MVLLIVNIYIFSLLSTPCNTKQSLGSMKLQETEKDKDEALISSAKFLSSKMSLYLYNSLIHLMCAIACVHGSTCANSLMCVKNTMHHFCL